MKFQVVDHGLVYNDTFDIPNKKRGYAFVATGMSDSRRGAFDNALEGIEVDEGCDTFPLQGDPAFQAEFAKCVNTRPTPDELEKLKQNENGEGEDYWLYAVTVYLQP